MDKPIEPSRDYDYYETGSTKPPKNHSGAIAVALILLVIYIGGYSTAGRLHASRENQVKSAEPTLAVQAQIVTDFSAEVPETEPAETAEMASANGLMPQMSYGGSYQMFLSASPESVENIPQEGGLSLQEIYIKAIDSVVSIRTEGQYVSATGTGVILSNSGYIVTNCHVVEGGTDFSVLLNDGRSFDAVLIGTDTVSDLAVLQINADGLVPAEFGDSTVLRVGDSVAAIGDPLGIRFRGTMTDGIISAINRDVVTHGRTMTLIQTNAALNEGNSGGPLLNCYGQVIGINTMKMGSSYYNGSVEGLGFAIPSTTVKEIVDQLIAQGYVSGRPDLGFDIETLSSFYQFYYKLPAGVYISDLPEGSNGAEAGICGGDIILYFEGQRVRSEEEIVTLLYSCEAGQEVDLVIYRAGEQLNFTVTLEEARG